MFGDSLAEELYYVVSQYCLHREKEPVPCLLRHAEMDLSEIADEYRSFLEDPDDVLEALSDMPDDVYRKYDRLLRDRITDLAEVMASGYMRECEADCGSDRGCLEECYKEHGIPRELWRF